VDVLTSSFSGNITHRHHPNQSQQEWSTEPVSAFAQHAPAGPLERHHHQQQQQQQGGVHNPSRLATAAAAAAAGVGQYLDNSSAGSSVDASDHLRQHHQQQQHAAGRSSGGGMYQLHRWDSAGSESKLPRYLVGGPSSSWGRLLLLLRSLDWVGFVRRFAGMTTRGMLILSTYTTANLVAAKGGTAMMAAHQVGRGLLVCSTQQQTWYLKYGRLLQASWDPEAVVLELVPHKLGICRSPAQCLRGAHKDAC
jgi:hypothetical protein